MENVTALHSLSIKTTKRVDFAGSITKHLKEHYNEVEASLHADAVSNLQRLRHDLCDLAPDSSGAAKLRNYLGELDVYLQVVPSQPVDAPFAWTDTFKGNGGVMSYLMPWTDTYIAQPSWSYERACVIYNLAVIESIQADAIPLVTEETCRAAGRLYCEAAAKFAYINKLRARDRAEDGTCIDLSQPAITMCTSLMKGRAQVCEYRARSIKHVAKDQLAAVLTQAIQYLDEAKLAVLAAGSNAGGIEQAYPWSTMLTFDMLLLTLIVHIEMAAYTTNSTGAGFGWGNRLADQIKLVSEALTSKERAGFVDLPAYSNRFKQLESTATLQRDANRTSLSDPRLDDRTLAVPPLVAIKIEDLTDLSFRSAQSAFQRLHSRDAFSLLQQAELRVSKLAVECDGRAQAAKATFSEVLSELSLPSKISAAYGIKCVPSEVWAAVEAVQRAGGIATLQEVLERNTHRSQLAESQLALVRETLQASIAVDAAAVAELGDRWQPTTNEAIAQEMRDELERYTAHVPFSRQIDNMLTTKLDAGRGQMTSLMAKKTDLDALLPPQYQANPTNPGCDADRTAQQVLQALSEGEALVASLPSLVSAVRTSFDRNALARAIREEAPTSWNSTVERVSLSQSPCALAFEAALTQLAAVQTKLRVLVSDFSRQIPLSPAYTEQVRYCDELRASVAAFEELSDGVNEGDAYYNEMQNSVDRLLNTAKKQHDQNILRKREVQDMVRRETMHRVVSASR